MKLSYRVSLVLAIPALVVLTGGVIAWRSLASTSEETAELADDLFREVAHLTAERAQSHVATIVPVVELLAESLGDDPSAVHDGALALEVTDAFELEPDLARISYVGMDGELVSLCHDADVEGQLDLDEGLMGEDGHLHVEEHQIVGDQVGPLLRTRIEDDPRELPFFAPARDARHRIWLPPRHLEETGAPGITLAIPVMTEEGQILGILAAELDLSTLGHFVTRLDMSERSRVLLMDSAGTLLAHPLGEARHEESVMGPEPLETLATIDDEPIRDFYAHMQHHGDDPRETHEHGVRFFNFRSGEEGAATHRWLASVLDFTIDDGVTWRVAALAPEEDFLGFIEASVHHAILVTIAALLVAVFASVFIASRVSEPIGGIVAQMAEVGRFELDSPAPKPSVFAEIAQMQAAVANMKGGLRSFASYVPRDVVRQVIAQGQEAKLGGSVREVTLFFSDLAGFTSLSEKVQPQELVDMLSSYLEAMTGVIQTQQGTVDKFMGDGIMAVWGAPKPSDDHAAMACEAAVLAQRKLDEMRERPETKWLIGARTRIGIATGTALVGNVGTHDRMNYTAMGDVVNLAARLEAQNKSYGTEVLVSESSYLAAKSRVLGRPLDVVAVKGKAQGVRVFGLLCLASEADDRTRSIAELSEQALTAYLARDFAKAAATYARVLEILPDDPAATVMRDRALAFETTPPPADWNGVYVSTTK
jgi:adenylate cyclase